VHLANFDDQGSEMGSSQNKGALELLVVVA
jgi:hypothetical protein